MSPALHIYTRGGWQKIAEFPASPISNITKCQNCGAPIKGPKCEYCDTIHYGNIDNHKIDNSIVNFGKTHTIYR